MPGRTGPSTIDRGGRELLRLGALVLLLGIAFVALLVEPTQASAPPIVERVVTSETRVAPSEAPQADPSPPEAVVPAPASVPATEAPVAFDGMRVRVARLGIDLPLLYGDTVRDTVLGSTPNDAAFLLPTSAAPGGGGNSYVYAHARAGMFLALWNARLGDVVEVIGPSSEVRRYVVTEIHPRVVPTDVRYTMPAGGERITLQTSTGPHDADPRFVVVAVRRS